jgi:hypothetical protein
MFFSRFEYHMFYVLYPFVTYFLTVPLGYNAVQSVESQPAFRLVFNGVHGITLSRLG